MQYRTQLREAVGENTFLKKELDAA